MVGALTRRELVSGMGASALSAGLSAMPSTAQADDFYQNKTLTVIVGFAPGGGVDTSSRVVARHLVRFIAGQPALVVQNMEGAAGVVAANYLARRVAMHVVLGKTVERFGAFKHRLQIVHRKVNVIGQRPRLFTARCHVDEREYYRTAVKIMPATANATSFDP
jgi:hypothetical protein